MEQCKRHSMCPVEDETAQWVELSCLSYIADTGIDR